MEVLSSLPYLIFLIWTAKAASPYLDVINSNPDLSQLAQAIKDTGFDSNILASLKAPVLMAPSNLVIDNFVGDWRKKGLNISRFSDLPKDLQFQILQYHLTEGQFTPYHICRDTYDSMSDLLTEDGIIINEKYKPVGPGDVIGSLYADTDFGIANICKKHHETQGHMCFQYCNGYVNVTTESMRLTIIDKYTQSKASFRMSDYQYHGTFVIYFIDQVLTPGVALEKLTALVNNDLYWDAINSNPNLSQLAQAIKDTGFHSKYMVSLNAQMLMAPIDLAFIHFVGDWRMKGLNISSFSDLPEDLQFQILEYHLTFSHWSPDVICKYVQDAVDNGILPTEDGILIGEKYKPVGPGDVIGSLYADTFGGMAHICNKHADPPGQKQCFLAKFCSPPLTVASEVVAAAIVDEYTKSRAYFGLSNAQFHGNFLIYFIDQVLIPGVALDKLNHMVKGAPLEGV